MLTLFLVGRVRFAIPALTGLLTITTLTGFAITALTRLTVTTLTRLVAALLTITAFTLLAIATLTGLVAALLVTIRRTIVVIATLTRLTVTTLTRLIAATVTIVVICTWTIATALRCTGTALQACPKTFRTETALIIISCVKTRTLIGWTLSGVNPWTRRTTGTELTLFSLKTLFWCFLLFLLVFEIHFTFSNY
jgi:hypothetical protein